jgi:hypothetical protein
VKLLLSNISGTQNAAADGRFSIYSAFRQTTGGSNLLDFRGLSTSQHVAEGSTAKIAN